MKLYKTGKNTDIVYDKVMHSAELPRSQMKVSSDSNFFQPKIYQYITLKAKISFFILTCVCACIQFMKK